MDLILACQALGEYFGTLGGDFCLFVQSEVLKWTLSPFWNSIALLAIVISCGNEVLEEVQCAKMSVLFVLSLFSEPFSSLCVEQ